MMEYFKIIDLYFFHILGKIKEINLKTFYHTKISQNDSQLCLSFLNLIQLFLSWYALKFIVIHTCYAYLKKSQQFYTMESGYLAQLILFFSITDLFFTNGCLLYPHNRRTV